MIDVKLQLTNVLAYEFAKSLLDNDGKLPEYLYFIDEKQKEIRKAELLLVEIAKLERKEYQAVSEKLDLTRSRFYVHISEPDGFGYEKDIMMSEFSDPTGVAWFTTEKEAELFLQALNMQKAKEIKR